MLAMLLAITSRLVCWAFMPVAAMASAFIVMSSDRHAAYFEIGGDDLVAYGDRRLQRLLGVHDGIDDRAHVAFALQRLHRKLLGLLQIVRHTVRRIAEHARKGLADAARRLRSIAEER